MAKIIQTPRKSILKGYMKLPVSSGDVSKFRTALRVLLQNMNEHESEEFNKDLVMQFLNQAYYSQYGSLVNTYGRTDLAIYDKTAEGNKKPVVLFEFKGPGRSDMITKDNFKKKSIYELVLYYLREEVVKKNHSIQHLVVTDCTQFFIFDKSCFYKLFAKNNSLVNDIVNADRNGESTDYIYREYIAPVVADVEDRMTCTYLNLLDYKSFAKDDDRQITPSFIAAYKLLSPTHLLRLPFSSDHNTLNNGFYKELLYIMGLVDKTDNKKKVIARPDRDKRQPYTLIEQTLAGLERNGTIANDKERLDVAIGLVLTWINRVLFLKLLESQLVAFNKSQDYKFLTSSKINDYGALDDLFDKVLAKPYGERGEPVKTLFDKVPYLNSSLFELAPLERKYFPVRFLQVGDVKLYSQTTLTDSRGRRRRGNINELEYLFSFLDAYDFGETHRENEFVSEHGTTIIDASVLGLIFEKINGYKDGSFFTPGYITQYICDHTIREAVVDRFNKVKGWNCEDFDSLCDRLPTVSREDRTEANNIINSLKICDIAVGSGHFPGVCT